MPVPRTVQKFALDDKICLNEQQEVHRQRPEMPILKSDTQHLLPMSPCHTGNVTHLNISPRNQDCLSRMLVLPSPAGISNVGIA